MKKNSIYKVVVSLIMVLALFTLPVLADGITFTVPGDSEGAKSEAAQKIELMMDIIQEEYYKDITEEELLKGALKGMFNALDDHSTYYSPEEYNEFMSGVSGSIVGIGVTIERRDGRITVVAPIEGTPAFEAGIKTGDKIIEVDGTDISDYTADAASKIIRGEEGTTVKIGIKRDGIKDLMYFELVREPIKINPVSYEIKEDNIGFIRLTDFNESSYEKMKEAVEFFIEKGIEGVIIDLRGNPGGLLDEVVDICRLLIPEGPIVKTQVKGEIIETYSSNLEKEPFKLAVLVNGGSASASEILAGAVRDSNTGILIGEKTYGKGTVQNISRIYDGSGVKLTVANYLTPSGFSLDGVGLTPDIEVKDNTSEILVEVAQMSSDRTLKRGLIGVDVLGLQKKLSHLGYYKGVHDGVFGSGTRAAVLSFQKDNNLPQDAEMDTNDQKVLDAKFTQTLQTQDPQLERAIEELKKILSNGR
jgi:carboxyl-terminal processing protease